MAMGFTRIAGTQEVAPGTGKQFTIGGRKVALFNVAGVFYAIDDNCPHRGAPLSEGECSGTELTCPWHGARFDLRTGANLGPPAQTPVASYRVELADDEVRIDLP
jgi:nitrite reductase/ring-hydroxylating ferredoxin subunit